METIYVTTTHFIRHTGNLVDLTEYRRKLAEAQPAQQEMPLCQVSEADPVPQHRRSARRRGRRAALTADWMASAAIVAAMVTFMVKIL